MLFISSSRIKRVVSRWLVRPFIVFVIGSVLILGVSSVQAKNIRKIPPKRSLVFLITSTPTSTPTQTPTPTLTSTPTPTSIPTKAPTPTLSPTPVIDVSEYLLAKVNEYRSSQGLGSVSSDVNTCDFAKKRAQEISSNFSHDGFKNLPYPSYSKVTENIAMTADFTGVIPMWAASSGHAENMRADTPFVCIEQFGSFYAYEGWRP